MAGMKLTLAQVDGLVSELANSTTLAMAVAAQIANTNANVATISNTVTNTVANVATLSTGLTNTNANVATVSTNLTNTNAALASTNANVATVSNTVTSVSSGYQTVVPVTINAGNVTLNLAGTNTLFQINTTANITSWTFQNMPPSGTAKSWTVQFIGGGVARTITWPASMVHNGGTTPTVNFTNGKVTTFTQLTYDGGTKIHNFKSGETG